MGRDRTFVTVFADDLRIQFGINICSSSASLARQANDQCVERICVLGVSLIVFAGRST